MTEFKTLRSLTHNARGNFLRFTNAFIKFDDTVDKVLPGDVTLGNRGPNVVTLLHSVLEVMPMTTTKISSREFNQDVGKAKRAAAKGPVVITDRGQPAYVLLRHDAYRKLLGRNPSILELLYEPGAEDVEFDPPRLGETVFKPAELD
jgi:hypothetical protein